MKQLVAFLLAVLVALAALTPCCTGEACPEELAASDQRGHQKADDGCGCSPFFACTGCVGFTFSEKPIAVPAPAEYRPQYFESALEPVSSTYPSAPWQPPRRG